MVYTGPSKGYKQCDEAKPACEKCQKSGRLCPGYRNPSTIRIRDMTATTIKRFGDSGGEIGASPINVNRGHVTLAAPLLHEYGTTSIAVRQACKSPDTAGHMPRGRRTTISRGRLRALQTLDPGYLCVLKRVIDQQNACQCLATSTSTLALAALSRLPSYRRVTMKARATYGAALKSIDATLGKPNSVVDDELLASLFLLALVEVRPIFQSKKCRNGSLRVRNLYQIILLDFIVIFLEPS
ncbi:hypothetical protein BKA67DRAFT_541842 [Truncatella angustata]|uniref:Zn(2)-C6 fungal-type domain-containing protein n=1 Tax=Truncatella angustata TaxID=152316 RepID=A0A9P8RGN4_9PEZI|nr:uncharacterized protein BKA67DRAFT_541842 [Truncatella angustata]KAH6645669.1 hypothetical protein BKA67DRAFT_541842 [Truncatella angustata]